MIITINNKNYLNQPNQLKGTRNQFGYLRPEVNDATTGSKRAMMSGLWRRKMKPNENGVINPFSNRHHSWSFTS